MGELDGVVCVCLDIFQFFVNNCERDVIRKPDNRHCSGKPESKDLVMPKHQSLGDTRRDTVVLRTVVGGVLQHPVAEAAGDDSSKISKKVRPERLAAVPSLQVPRQIIPQPGGIHEERVLQAAGGRSWDLQLQVGPTERITKHEAQAAGQVGGISPPESRRQQAQSEVVAAPPILEESARDIRRRDVVESGYPSDKTQRRIHASLHPGSELP
ncbi:unnamed protein product [Trichogramma brassicae]|uniref:Uncharacterized protein n=1 Tax=Trichogramma brassicae TaxID=86971 RepID=A0A6H5I5E7_9HYME|nr:unnamed protein product [Trichogramma brassicae]